MATDDLRTVFNVPNRPTAKAYLAKLVQKYDQTAFRLAGWLETNVPQGFTAFDFLPTHRRRIRTSNGLERLSREIRRRTRVVSIFPNKVSYLRLVSAILMEVDEEW